MGVAAVSADVLLSRLADQLREERYQCHVVDRYVAVARRFLPHDVAAIAAQSKTQCSRRRARVREWILNLSGILTLPGPS